MVQNPAANARDVRVVGSEGEGEGGMIWENDILTCILSCELNRQSMSDAGCSMLGAGTWG